jgi:hypothetical protein
MFRSLPPSALALALGTPAYGMPAIGGPLPDAALGPPSALTPHEPMRAIPAPTPRPASADSVRPPARPDSLRAPATPATPVAAPATTSALGTPAQNASGGEVAAPAAPTAPAAVGRVPVARVLGVPVGKRGATPVRLELSVAARTLVALQGDDTLLVAAAGVGTGDSVRYGARTWRFDTPPGRRTVRAKQAAPVWVPPEWHYAELAAKRGFTLRHLREGRAEALTGGRRLVVRGGRVGVVARDGAYAALPADQEIVFDGVLYVPPFGTANRRVPGQLGAYRLDLGDGFLIHGTPVETTVGTPSSHGCIRLAGDALAWVFAHVPVGTAVDIR